MDVVGRAPGGGGGVLEDLYSERGARVSPFFFFRQWISGGGFLASCVAVCITEYVTGHLVRQIWRG